MKDYEVAIYKFIHQMGYLLDNNCEGIILYGSRQHGFEKEDSDIDLCIIYRNDSSKSDTRGYYNVDNYRIEFFEHTIESIMQKVKLDLKNGSNAALSMIGYGKILFDRNNAIHRTQERIIDFYNKNTLPTLSEDEEKCISFTFKNRLLELDRLEKTNSPYFNHFYHIVLEKIREFYYAKNGLPKIPESKVFDFYTDDTYSKKLLKVTPPVDFIELYFTALDESKSNEERLDNLKTLYCYVRGQDDLEFKETRVEMQPMQVKRKTKSRIFLDTYQY